MVKIGRYTGNQRLDPKKDKLVEVEMDDENTRKLWFEEIQTDPDFLQDEQARIDKWKQALSISTDPNGFNVHCVGESHIDVAWLWRFEQTRQKAIKTFQKAVIHAKLFPKQFCYALSTPILLQWVKEDDPKLFKDIQDTVKTGGIELVGGALLEPDCMMPSGEAFVRQRLYGMRFYNENFGVLPTVEWFLDSFGYNWGLPQILTKSETKYFWTSKMTWNNQTTFPFVHFWWEGPDGSRLLTANFGMGSGPIDSWWKFEPGHHLLKPDGRKVWNYTMNYAELEDHVDENEVVKSIGYFFGRGDGGHGPAHQEVASANAIVKLGFMKWSRVENFYKEIEQVADRLPVWQDEMYLENHRGTFSVHAEVKRHNRKFENMLVNFESLAVLTNLANPKYVYPRDLLEKYWWIVLKNQFHDVLPGSSIPEVYDDCWDDWMTLNQSFDAMAKLIGDLFASPSKEGTETPLTTHFMLYNPVAWKRKSRVFIPITVFTKPPKLDAAGKPNYVKLLVQNASKTEYIGQPIAAEPAETIEPMLAGWWIVGEFNGLSMIPVQLSILSDEESNTIAAKTVLSASNHQISNRLVSVSLDDKSGAIVQLTSSKINRGENLLISDQSNLAFGYMDDSHQWPAWNLKQEYWKYPVDLPSTNIKVTVTEIGPVFATVMITRMLGPSPTTQKISLFTECPEVFFEYLHDWKRPQTMLKVLYSTATNATSCIADITYAAIKRSTLPTTPCDKARYEKICHKYFDLSTPDNKWGIAMLNEGKYAFDAAGGDMRITMLRSPLYPGPAGESWAHKERLMNVEKKDHKVPVYSGLGPFKCRYALLPHNGGTLLDAKGFPNPIVKQKAEEFNQPMIIIPTSSNQLANESLPSILTSGDSLLEILSTNVFLGALKYNEWDRKSSLILRVVEGLGLANRAKIQFNSLLSSRITKIQAVNLLERPIAQNILWNPQKGLLEFDIGKFEIVTFELEI